VAPGLEAFGGLISAEFIAAAFTENLKFWRHTVKFWYNLSILSPQLTVIPMNGLDAIDRKILGLLQSDGRITMAELAEKVGLSASPCHRRVKLLEERGVITRYIATVDQKAVGLHVSVFISIKLARQKEEDLNRFARAISKWDEVLECYLMTGNRDYLLRVVVADLSSYEAFLKNKLTRLDGIASIESSFALSQVKYSIALPV
jgi:Lrp/AsnC family leucine-responsive transcriptional regulator